MASRRKRLHLKPRVLPRRLSERFGPKWSHIRLLNEKERQIYFQGRIWELKKIHEDLDRAVLEAYGWDDLIPMYDDPTRREEFEQIVLERLVALNQERVEEEKRGLVRWLRPEYQIPLYGADSKQGELFDEAPEPAVTAVAAATTKRQWPGTLKLQVMEIKALVMNEARALSAKEVASRFTRAPTGRVAEILQSLVLIGQLREIEEHRFIY